MSRNHANATSGESPNEPAGREPIGSRDKSVGCPVCFVDYAAPPERCESCGYRFGGRR